jgi:uncharacterized protein (TIGR03437 family)
MADLRRFLTLLAIVSVAVPALGQNRQRNAFPQVGELPLGFELNVGQTDPSVRYLVHSGRQTLFLTADQAVIHLVSFEGGSPGHARSARVLASRKLRDATIRMGLHNGLKASSIDPLESLPGKVNYLLGKDPAKWITGVPTYARIAYRDVYRGIDLFYYGRQGALEYDFVARPGADPRAIQVEFEGASQIRVSGDGDLILDSPAGQALWKRPYVYQEENGVRRQIAADYRIGKKSRVGFLLAQYDRTRPLVIDPVLVYSTFLGGGGVELGVGVAQDRTGLYAAGITYSSNFPTTPGGGQLDGTYDVFATKLNPQGSQLIYSTYLGGSGNNGLNAFHLAADGSVYLAGFTSSYDFPTTSGAYSTSYNGGLEEVFVSRLAPAGNSLILSTYIGGSYDDDAFGIALDSSGSVYVSGYTASFDYPTTTGAFQTYLLGNTNAFVTKLNATGTALVYSTLLGGSGDEAVLTSAFGLTPPQIAFDFGSQIAVDASGYAYVAGVTTSSDFLTTAGAYSTVNQGGGGDAFLAKLLPDGSGLVYSTLLGGSSFDAATSVSVDASGSALLGGVTSSSNFPTTPGAFSGTFKGTKGNAFIARFDPTGSTLTYSTFFGGSTYEAYAVAAMASDGRILLSGLTYSDDLPTTPGTYQPAYAGSGDVFLALFNPSITTLIYCTYLGTSAFDSGTGTFGLSSSAILVTGETESSNFPTTTGAYQTTYGGGTTDAFIARFVLPGPSIGQGGVVSASSFGEFAAVSPGSWIEIYGSNLAVDTRSWAASDFNGVNAPTSLDGTSVTIGGQAAFIDYISPGQVNALMASNVATGGQPLTVTVGSVTSAAYSITVNPVQPGLDAPPSFKINGTQYVVATFADGAYVLPEGVIAGLNSRPAQPGDEVVLYGVGFGPVTPNIPAGQLVQQLNTLASPFDISIGGVAANVPYSGLAPDYTGLYQFNVVVPASVGSGAVPLTFTVGGVAGTQTLYLAVSN